jgi:hypothetical protein
MRLHSSANFRYVSASRIIRRFALQSDVCYCVYADTILKHQQEQSTGRPGSHFANGFRGGSMSEYQYRHYAVECLVLAREMRGGAQKAVLLAMADAWAALADQAAAATAQVALETRTAPEGEEPV